MSVETYSEHFREHFLKVDEAMKKLPATKTMSTDAEYDAAVKAVEAETALHGVEAGKSLALLMVARSKPRTAMPSARADRVEAENAEAAKAVGDKAYDAAEKSVNQENALHGPERAELLAATMLARTQPRRSL